MQFFKTCVFLSLILIAENLCAFQPKFDTDFNKDKIENLLWDTSDNLADNGAYKKVIELNKKLIEDCEKADYKEGIIKGYCNLGNIFGRMGKHKDSFLLLKLAEKENGKLNNIELAATIYSEFGKNYYLLDLYNEALRYFEKSLSLTREISNKEKRDKLYNFSYGNIIVIYEIQGKMDSAFYYSKEAFSKVQDLYNSNTLAYYYLHYKKDIKTAEYYLTSANKISCKDKNASKFDLYGLQRMWGELYEQKKSYDTAKVYFLKSLKIAKETHLPETIRDTYWLLHRISDSLKDKDASNQYFHEYAKLYDSISKKKKPQYEFVIEQYVQEKEEKYKQDETKLYYIIFLLVVLTGVGIWIFRRTSRKIEMTLKDEIKENKEIIIEKEEEAKELKSKINEGFDEIVNLAKKNSPEFVARFIEVYPEFYQALLKIYPDISSDTLKFCGLLKLNFSTKEIAEYNFITPRAIQLRKNRIRKKLGISSTEDIYTWMHNIDKK